MAINDQVPAVRIEDLSRVHFIAIGGAGMSGIARLFADAGVEVTGSDHVDSPTLRQLADSGVTTFVGHDSDQVGSAQVVVVSSAIREDNVELMAARRRGIPVWHRSTALAALMRERTGVSIAGTHGKTTTTAMTAVMVAAAGPDPSYVIGSPLASTGLSAHLSAIPDHGSAIMVVEADESDGSFLNYPTAIAVVTNLEADHLDHWGNSEAYFDGFVDFATQPGLRALVTSADDPGAVELAERVRAHGVTVITFGEAAGADIVLSDLSYHGTTASAKLAYGGDAGTLALQVPGRYNLHNAAAAYGVGRVLGLNHERLLAGAADFTGTLRRFQLVADVGGVRIYDDYAHHPTELRVALTAARRAAGDGRLIACFQPHLYSRTAEFADDFGASLALADVVVVTDVYAAREDPVAGVSGQLVAEAAIAAGATDVTYIPDKAELPTYLAARAEPGDLVMTLGAGDVTLVGPMVAELIAGPPQENLDQGTS